MGNSGVRGSPKAPAAAAKQAVRAPARVSQLATPSGNSLSRLPQQLGNRAMGRLLAANRIQAKLVVAPAGDPLEREADGLADAVFRAPAAAPPRVTPHASFPVQRKCAACAHDALENRAARPRLTPHTEIVQRKCAECESTASGVQLSRTGETDDRERMLPRSLETEVSSLRAAGGSPLPPQVRDFLESRLEADLGQVRVHTDRRATETAGALSARAFTVGHDIAFGPGQFTPNTRSGRWLIAHEVAHVIQQTGRTPVRGSKPAEASNAAPRASSVGAPDRGGLSAAPASAVQRSVFDNPLDLLSPSALLGSLWLTLDKKNKIYVIDKVISFATTVVEKFPGKVLMGGFWVLFREGMLGFYGKLKTASVDVKINAVDKLAMIISGRDANYLLAYLKGLAKGFFIDGAFGIFIAIWELGKGLVKLWDFIKGIGQAIGRFPKKVEDIVQGFFSLGRTIAANFWPAVEDFISAAADSEKRNAFLGSVTEGAKGLAKQAGGKLADSILSLFSKPEASTELGETIGSVSGQVLWEVVLAVFTAGAGAGVTAAKVSIRSAARMLEKLVGRVVSGVLKIVAEIRTAFGTAVQWIKGAIKAAKGKLSEIGGQLAKLMEKVGEFLGVLLRNCHESKLVCELGEAVVEKVARLKILTKGEAVYTIDEATGLTIKAEGKIAGSHPLRKKGYRPEPLGGRAPKEHRGHLLPEGGFANPADVNVKENLISEASGSNLGMKKSLDLKASKLADDNPNSVVKMIAEVLRKSGETRPYAVTYTVTLDGKAVQWLTVLNR